MSQSRPPSSPAAVIIAVMVGGALATTIGTVLSFAADYVLNGSITAGSGLHVSLTTYRLVGAVVSLITGAVAGASVLPLRPQGPIGPLAAGLAAVSGLIADRVGSLFGFLLFAIVSDVHIPVDQVDLKFCIDFLTHVDGVWGVIFIILPLAAGGGVAFLRVMSVSKSAPYGQQPMGRPAFPGQAPYGQPYGQSPGQPPVQPYGQSPGQPYGQQYGQQYGQPQPGFPPAGPQGPPPPPGGPWPPQDRPGG
jgi:hypothetical protein